MSSELRWWHLCPQCAAPEHMHDICRSEVQYGPSCINIKITAYKHHHQDCNKCMLSGTYLGKGAKSVDSGLAAGDSEGQGGPHLRKAGHQRGGGRAGGAVHLEPLAGAGACSNQRNHSFAMMTKRAICMKSMEMAGRRLVAWGEMAKGG